MPAKIVVFALITFLHDLATVVWIGGLFALSLLVIPAVRKAVGKSPQAGEIVGTIQRRFRGFVVASIVTLGITGILMSKRSGYVVEAFSFANLYAGVLSVKHILVILMIAFAFIMNLMRKKSRGGPGAFLLVNLILGILILLLSGLNAAIASIPVAAGL